MHFECKKVRARYISENKFTFIKNQGSREAVPIWIFSSSQFKYLIPNGYHLSNSTEWLTLSAAPEDQYLNSCRGN